MDRRLTEIIFIIDKSKAMRGLEDAMVKEFNSMLGQQQGMEGEALITTVLFDDRYELFHDRTTIQAAAPLGREDYEVRGGTALLDAIGMSMHKFRRVRHGTRENFRSDKVVFIIIAGGRDNASRGYTEEMIRKRIIYRKQKYEWEFIFFGGNMDAEAEAGKIGIMAEQAYGYNADTDGIHTVYTAVSVLLTAFQKEADFPCRDTSRKDNRDIAERAAGNVLSKFRAEKEKITFSIDRILRSIYKQNKDSAMEVLHAHLGNSIVITGTWEEAEGERELEEEELFEGEITAVVFTMGCYTVRIAECLYKDSDFMQYMQRIPASQDIITRYRVRHIEEARERAAGRTVVGSIMELSWENGVRKVTEVSARYRSGSDELVERWQNICIAAKTRGGIGSASIDYICTVKRCHEVSDEHAALFVLSRYLGDTHTDETWYKFTPDGIVESYRIDGYGQNDTDVWEL